MFTPLDSHNRSWRISGNKVPVRFTSSRSTSPSFEWSSSNLGGPSQCHQSSARSEQATTFVQSTKLADSFLPEYFSAAEAVRIRAYVPGSGRWLSRDPIAEAGGINLYGYVGNDPVDLFDPLGLSSVVSCAGEAFLGIEVPVAAAMAALGPIPKVMVGEMPKPGADRMTSGARRLSVAIMRANDSKRTIMSNALSGFADAMKGRGVKLGGKMAARAVPILGWALLAYDTYKFASCLGQ